MIIINYDYEVKKKKDYLIFKIILKKHSHDNTSIRKKKFFLIHPLSYSSIIYINIDYNFIVIIKNTYLLIVIKQKNDFDILFLCKTM